MSPITDESSKGWALRGIVEALATTDPDRAERLANSITYKSAKALALALSSIAKALAVPSM